MNSWWLDSRDVPALSVCVHQSSLGASSSWPCLLYVQQTFSATEL